jgi:hypothetical protein
MKVRSPARDQGIIPFILSQTFLLFYEEHQNGRNDPAG